MIIINMYIYIYVYVCICIGINTYINKGGVTLNGELSWYTEVSFGS